MPTRKTARNAGASSARRVLNICAQYSERHVCFCFEDAAAVSSAGFASGGKGCGDGLGAYASRAEDQSDVSGHVSGCAC